MSRASATSTTPRPDPAFSLHLNGQLAAMPIWRIRLISPPIYYVTKSWFRRTYPVKWSTRLKLKLITGRLRRLDHIIWKCSTIIRLHPGSCCAPTHSLARPALSRTTTTPSHYYLLSAPLTQIRLHSHTPPLRTHTHPSPGPSPLRWPNRRPRLFCPPSPLRNL